MPDNKRGGKNTSYCIALSGILSAICVVLMFCTGIIPIGIYILPAVCSLVIWIVFRELGRKWAFMCYGSVALLTVLLTPEMESKLLFAAFFGYYPVIRDLLCKIKPGFLSGIARFLVFNIPCIIIYALMMNVMGMGDLLEDFADFGQFAVLIFWALGNFIFICYDIFFSQMPFLYDKLLRNKISRLLR